MSDANVIEMLEEPAPTRLPAVASELGGPLGAAMQALKLGVSVADMKDMLALQKDWEANEARKAYVADMAAFKLNPPEIFKTKAVSIKTRDGGQGPQYSHATLGEVCEKIVEGLAKHGFSHRWDTRQPEGGQIFVTCTLTHRLGHSESTTLNSSRDETGAKNNIQSLSSTITYLQRYTLLGASGLATKDMPDDDGKGADGGNTDPIYNAAANLMAWTKKAIEAKTFEQLKKVRHDANVDFLENHDPESWEEFKKVCSNHHGKLMGGASA